MGLLVFVLVLSISGIVFVLVMTLYDYWTYKAPVPSTTPGINARRYDLATIHEYNAPRSMYLRLYVRWAKENNDPAWKGDFLAFCKAKNIDIDEETLDKVVLLM
jgi:hypothetical protein